MGVSSNTPPVPAPKTGNEPFFVGGGAQQDTVLDFWRWAASNLAGNALRGLLAEYLVARALGLTQTGRVEWDAFDLQTLSRTKIEVKSAAYVQAWAQKKHSAIRFGIRPTRAWAAGSGSYATGERQADLYVFCLLHHKDRATLDPLHLDQWTFFIVPTRTLNARFPTQQSIGLTALLSLHPRQAGYEHLASAVNDYENSYENADFNHGS